MYRNAKQINILGLRCRKLGIFPGKFLNFGKSAGVKDLTNIMSGAALVWVDKPARLITRLFFLFVSDGVKLKKSANRMLSSVGVDGRNLKPKFDDKIFEINLYK